MRTKRCTPFSARNIPYAFLPSKVTVALFTPASSPGKISARSTLKWCCSPQRVNMRNNICVQSCASVPPAPACSVKIALLPSYSPDSINSISLASTIAESSSEVSSSASASCQSCSTSLMRSESDSYVSIVSFKSVASLDTFFALSASFQKFGSLILIS